MRTTVAAFALLLAPAALADARDPFAPLVVDDGLEKRPPLERVELGAVVVQAVVAGTTSPRALVKLPDGTTHVVRVGDALGRRLGRITAIRASGVEVTEAWRTPIGGLAKERTLLTLR